MSADAKQEVAAPARAADSIAGQEQTEIPPNLPAEDPYATKAPHGETTPVIAQPEWPTIPGYQILAELGRGGMGVVYKARQLSLQRLVALKMVRTGPFASAEERHRFHLEAEVVAKLHHPNIVQIFETGELQGQSYLVLELIEGHSLQKQMGSAWRPQEAAQLMETLSRAMHYAHEHGIVHRDLKPANILIHLENWGGPADNRQGDQAPTVCNLPSATPKITDFGLAKLMAADSVGPTVTGDFLGTPTYSAPEQAAGKIHEIGPHTDVYSLGAILYELLTGRPPFQGATVLETLDQVRTQEPTSLSRIQKKVPRDLETICLKCLQKDPRKRYSSALLLAEDLGRYLTGQPIQARRIGVGERLVKWARRRPAIAALIAVVALAALGLGIGGWWSAMELGAAADRESKERQLAQENLVLSVEAVERMLNDVGSVDLAEVPQMEEVRKKLLLQAQEFYDKFLQNPGSGPQIRYLAGRALGRLGDIHEMLGENAAAGKSYVEARGRLDGDSAEQRRELARVSNNLGVLFKKLGRYPEAEKVLQEALNLRQQLAKENPANADASRDLAATFYTRGTVLAKLAQQRSQARQAYLDALKIQQDLAKAHPENAEYQSDRARTLNNLGILLFGVKNLEAETEKAFRGAIAIYKELVNKNQGVSGYRFQLARNYSNLASVYRVSRKTEQAEKNYGHALDLLKQLAVDFPKVPLYRQELAGVYRNIGIFYDKCNRAADADRAFQQALKLRRKVAAEAPNVPDYQQTLANLHDDLGTMLREKKNFVKAAEHFRHAVSLLEKIATPNCRPAYQSDLAKALNNQALVLLEQGQRFGAWLGPAVVLLESAAGNPLGSAGLAWHREGTLLQARIYLERAVACQNLARKADPYNTYYPRLLNHHLQDLASCQLLLLDHEGAARTARELPKLYPDRKEQYVFAAEFLARAIPLAQDDARLSLHQRKETSEQDAREAIRMLRSAIDRGFDNLNYLRTLPAFRLLRQRPDFQRLIDGLDKNKVRNA
jgi:tetratricopeptide (TPR) repeat protein/tRNA A-37 threonylcarbamoyl transferase component Bud32